MSRGLAAARRLAIGVQSGRDCDTGRRPPEVRDTIPAMFARWEPA
ncbi:MAG: hypothetical protein OXG81_06575 [Acidobacteria bacterium]|nr:hypothetical protein [Acidobacteriota bacterium]